MVQPGSDAAETYDNLTIIIKRPKIDKNTTFVSYCIY